MHILKRFNRMIVVACLALALGLGFTAVQQTVSAKPANADILAVYIAKTSQRNIKGCDEYNLQGLCQTMRPGQWFAMGNGVASIRVSAGCELWVHGVREDKRKDHDWTKNFWSRESKATIRMSNCR